MGHELSDEKYYTGLALADPDGVQSYQYKGKTWKADDIYEAMTKLESTTGPDYIVAEVKGDHFVLSRRDSGVYRPKGNFGDMAQDAKQVAAMLNAYRPKSD